MNVVDSRIYNSTTLHLWMKQNNIKEIVVDYAGSGDSGHISTIYDDKENNIIEATVPQLSNVTKRYLLDDLTPVENIGFELKAGKLETIIYDLWGHALEITGNLGFENNEGGEGNLIIHDDMSAVLEHTNNYYQYEDFQPFHSTATDKKIEIDKIIAYLKSNNMNSIQIDFCIYDGVELEEDFDDEIDSEVRRLVSACLGDIVKYDFDHADGIIDIQDDKKISINLTAAAILSNSEYHKFHFEYDKSYLDKINDLKSKKRASP